MIKKAFLAGVGICLVGMVFFGRDAFLKQFLRQGKF